MLTAIRGGVLPAPVAGRLDEAQASRARRMLGRWQERRPGVPPDAGIGEAERAGIRLLCPADPGWPPGLDDLGVRRPYALWVRGDGGLAAACWRPVSIVGTRAATAYGGHLAGALAAAVAGPGWAVISGGAYGIDACAHRGALAAGGVTVAVLASGVDDPYPRGHRDLFDAITGRGVLVSELPPGRLPDRAAFLARNRITAALSRATVVVEATLRGGSLNTARRALGLRRPVMAVPGPVTSAASAGCHALIRDGHAVLVTNASDVLAGLARCGGP